MKSGVYYILNTENQRHYVGSATDLQKRWNRHLSFLRAGKHVNRKLQNAFDKYGESAFTFHVMERVSTERLTAREQFWMDETLPFYNILRVARSSAGFKHSEETRARMSAAQRLAQRKIDPQTKLRAIERRKKTLQGRDIGALISAARSTRSYLVVSPEGERFECSNLNKFCRDHGLTQACMADVLRGRQKQHKGWTVTDLGIAAVS
jgi:group I intron endonuclease